MIEEFFPGENVYVRDGYLVSRAVGVAIADMEDRVLNVKAAKELPLPKAGESVYALVSNVKDLVAFLEVFYIEDRDKFLPTPLSGFLHVSNASSSYVKSLYDIMGYGDIVRAKVLESGSPPVILSLKGREYGVILAKCPMCMKPLRRKGLYLYCFSCGKSFKRKVSSRYLVR